MGDLDRESKEDNKANPLMVVKKDQAWIGEEDVIAGAAWPQEGHPVAETRKTTGTEVLSNDATFSEHNLFLYRSNPYEKSNHRFKRYQNNTSKQQLSSTSPSDGQRR
jgi:hypothetical protein